MKNLRNQEKRTYKKKNKKGEITMKKRMMKMVVAATLILSVPVIGHAEETKKIAIVPWDMAESFAVDFSHRAQEEIEEKGWEAVVMDPKGDWAQEYTILENLITQKIDGVISVSYTHLTLPTIA